MKEQRLRFRYRVTPAGTALNQREVVSAWERAVKEAGLPLTYSEGKRPAPQLSVAAPLPHGVTSGWELIDVYLDEPVQPRKALALVATHLPDGLEALSAQEVGVSGPSLQSQLRWAEYEAELPADGLSPERVCEAIARLLKADTWPAEYRRETKVRLYDLRPLVLDIGVQEARTDALVLRMRLRAEPENTARADQVLPALGLPPATRIHRCRLYVEESQAAVLAYRRLGQTTET